MERPPGRITQGWWETIMETAGHRPVGERSSEQLGRDQVALANQARETGRVGAAVRQGSRVQPPASARPPPVH